MRYDEDSKLDIRSDLEDGEPIRCIVPTGRTRISSFQQGSRPPLTSYLPNKVKYGGSNQKRPQSFNKNNPNI